MDKSSTFDLRTWIKKKLIVLDLIVETIARPKAFILHSQYLKSKPLKNM